MPPQQNRAPTPNAQPSPQPAPKPTAQQAVELPARPQYFRKIVLNSETLEVIERVPSGYDGPADLCKASSQETAIAGQQSNFFNTLLSDYNQQFGNQSAILKQMTNAFSPIVAAGPNQQGFSPSELATLNTTAINSTGAEYQKAAGAARGALAGRGDDSGLTSGVDASIQGNIAAQAAGKESSNLLGIDEANYAQGRQNFFAASSALGSAAGMMNPTAYAGEAGGAGANAFGEANTMAQQNDTFGQVAGILGGAASAWLGGNPFSTGGGNSTPLVQNMPSNPNITSGPGAG